MQHLVEKAMFSVACVLLHPVRAFSRTPRAQRMSVSKVRQCFLSQKAKYCVPPHEATYRAWGGGEYYAVPSWRQSEGKCMQRGTSRDSGLI